MTTDPHLWPPEASEAIRAELVTVDLDSLESLARYATPGPWFAWDRGVGWHIALDPDGDRLLPEGFRTDLARGEDARYIAAASPDVMLALVKRVRAAERLLEQEAAR